MFNKNIHLNCIDRLINKNNGYSLIELILVMVLIVIFGLSTFTLVVSGNNAYKNIVEKKTLNSELRVAVSYLDMKLRQGDGQGEIHVKKIPNGHNNAIVIQELVEGKTYETWIFFNNGKLREAFILQGTPIVDQNSFAVAEIDGFDLRYDKSIGLINFNVWKELNNKKYSFDSIIYLKSVGGI